MNLDPLRFRWLRLRHDWWFRWAHDPLCDRLGGGVLRIGRLRLCRSCAVMYAGVVGGAAIGLSVRRVGRWPAAPLVWLGSVAVAGGLSMPAAYRRLDRPAKDAVRGATGVEAGLLAALPLARRWGWSAVLAGVAAAGYRLLTRARAKAKAKACEGCPELELDRVCSGYSQQLVSLRAYERQASELRMRSLAGAR